MTDNDIKIVLELLHKRILHSKIAEEVTEAEIMALVEVVDLINRQKAEIERLKHEYSNAVLTIESKQSFIEYLKDYAKERKIEEIENRGIKKFSRRLQGELKKRRKMSNSLTEKTMIGYFLIDIDNLVKEITENITKIEHNSLCETEIYKGSE